MNINKMPLMSVHKMPLMKVAVFNFCPLVVGYLDFGIMWVNISLL